MLLKEEKKSETLWSLFSFQLLSLQNRVFIIIFFFLDSFVTLLSSIFITAVSTMSTSDSAARIACELYSFRREFKRDDLEMTLFGK